jgi:GNAT superfamily N-acetyltransferase
VVVPVQLATRPEIDDAALSRLHARAFGEPCVLEPWRKRLDEHSLTWVGARDGRDRLVGFVNVAWDGAAHAFVLDLVVDPDHQRRGLGEVLVARAAREAAAAGCHWLHVDFEAHLRPFYLGACGFQPTAAGLLRLDEQSP